MARLRVALLGAWLTAVVVWAAPAFGQDGPLAAAERARQLNDFDRVATLARGSDAPRAGVLLALADAGRGRYEAAEARLAELAAAAPPGDAALELGLLRLPLGDRIDGRLDPRTLINRTSASTAADYLRLGRAARALGDFEAANTYFRSANAAAPGDPEANTAWGELFFDRHQNQEAFDSFQIALDSDPDYVPAQLGVIRVFLSDNPPEARQRLQALRALHADNVDVLLIDAALALDDRDRDEARAFIARVQAVNANSLDAHALAGALAFLEGREADFEAAARAALAINPVYGEAYRVAGDHAARNYLFEEAVGLTRRALEVDPGSAAAWAALGMHLLRTGDEAEARTALERAFEADPYDVVTFNSLALLDTLDTFVTVEQGDVIMRLPPEEAAVLREFAMPLAQEALDTLSELYGFRPEGPILIEIFPRHDDFAVRTLGLPGFLGALGACFGSVVTMDSPTARAPGTFSWEATLWHEIAHVMTLQMSSNRVPRWLSEGVSVFEERRARPEWGRETLVSFVQAMAADELVPLDELNEAFTNPETINLAYFQSSVVVDHVIDEFGEPEFYALVRSFGDGLETEEAVARELGLSMAELQASFEVYLQRTYGGLAEALARPAGVQGGEDLATLRILTEASPDSFGLRMLLARALYDGGDAVAAITQLERAAALVPQAGGNANPNALIAQIALETGDTARAIEALEAVIEIDHYDVETARRLARLATEEGRPDVAAVAWARLASADPFDGEAQRQVGLALLEAGEADEAARALRAALASVPVDRAQAHLELAEAQLAAGDTAEAKTQVLSALEIAPSFERAQDLLLTIIDAELGP
jgi:tetratricopeptide (TPR) repeat protein